MNDTERFKITFISLFLTTATQSFAGGPCVPGWDESIGDPAFNGEVLAAVVGPSGDPVVAGAFSEVGGQSVMRIASWDGSQWVPLGSGFNDQGRALEVYQGSLYAGGIFDIAGGIPAGGIASWDGSAWAQPAGGVDRAVVALSVSSISGQELLYAGGDFSNAGGGPAKRIASWDGSAWAALGNGVTIPGEASAVFAIQEFDLGAGPLLAVGGVFTVAGGAFASNVAIWDGANWAPMGDGMDGAVRSFEVFDDGSGPALYAGGDFDTAGGLPAKRVAKWDGSSWSAAGQGGSWGQGSRVRTLSVFDDGDGPRLIAGGEFLLVDGASVNYLAAWDGAVWSTAFGGADGKVAASFVMDDGVSSSLLVGGAFSDTGGVDAGSVGARVGCAAALTPGDINGDGVVDTADLGVLIANFGTNDPGSDINEDGIVDTADLGLLIANFGA